MRTRKTTIVGGNRKKIMGVGLGRIWEFIVGGRVFEVLGVSIAAWEKQLSYN